MQDHGWITFFTRKASSESMSGHQLGVDLSSDLCISATLNLTHICIHGHAGDQRGAWTAAEESQGTQQ